MPTFSASEPDSEGMLVPIAAIGPDPADGIDPEGPSSAAALKIEGARQHIRGVGSACTPGLDRVPTSRRADVVGRRPLSYMAHNGMLPAGCNDLADLARDPEQHWSGRRTGHRETATAPTS